MEEKLVAKIERYKKKLENCHNDQERIDIQDDIDRMKEELRRTHHDIPISLTMSSDTSGVQSGNKQVYAHHYYEASANNSANDTTLLVDYLYKAASTCDIISLGQLDGSEAVGHKAMTLSQVYISLNTTNNVDMSDDEKLSEYTKTPKYRNRFNVRPLTTIEAIGKSKYVMLLGAPGSGKTTFIDYLTVCLARIKRYLYEEKTKDREVWVDKLVGWSKEFYIPVKINLREWAVSSDVASARRGSISLLQKILRQQLTFIDCGDSYELVWKSLCSGAALLLLDGLDEVVNIQALKIISESISIARVELNAPIVVTCRTLDYDYEPLRQLDCFDTFTLAPFTNEQIDQFVDAWYIQYNESRKRPIGQAKRDALDLRKAIEDRTDLRELAALPLLLTVMAIVHASEGRLPDARSLLYYKSIEILLLRWRQPKDEPDIIQRLDIPDFRHANLVNIMARIGYEAHDKNDRDKHFDAKYSRTVLPPSDISEGIIDVVIKDYLSTKTHDDRQLDIWSINLRYELANRNGLLLKRGPKLFSFPHRTFQEFLAGYYLAGHRNRRILCRERAISAHWHESIMLMIGYRVLSPEANDIEFPLDVVQDLKNQDPLSQILAGEILALVGHGRTSNYDAALVQSNGLWRQVVSNLVKLAFDEESPLDCSLRVRAARIHGLLCFGPLENSDHSQPVFPAPDPRLPLAVVGLPENDSKKWVLALHHYLYQIEGGEFWHGDEEKQQARSIQLPYSFMIGKYPITNAEYARFVRSGGYKNERWWTPNGWKFIQPGGHPWDDQSRIIDGPRLWNDVRFNGPTQPVVAISWYEAAAYCRWLTEKGHKTGWLPRNRHFRLPTSLEWERAARHTDHRQYPWGNESPGPEFANYEITRVGAPSPVGCFPKGQSFDGIQDLAGNVVEWLSTSHYEPTETIAVNDFSPGAGVLLAHSSFWHDAEHLHCGSRSRVNPYHWYDHRGFRIVCASIR